MGKGRNGEKRKPGKGEPGVFQSPVKTFNRQENFNNQYVRIKQLQYTS